MFKPNAILTTDFYKIGHVFQYPEKTTKVYSNLTPRDNKYTICNDSPFFDGKMVFFGLQYFIKSFLIEQFNETFFNKPLISVLSDYQCRVMSSLGILIPRTHIETLHKLGYLPIEIKALPEGSRVNMRIPVLTITNTHTEFYWLTNFLETALSAVLWKMCNNASIAFEYKRILTEYANKTGVPLDSVSYQGHDFSFRGMSGIEDAMCSGMAHLTSFKGTDTIPAIEALEYYYDATVSEDVIGCSIPATEHSVMCSGGKDTEIETFKRLITQVYSSGFVSIVSDTWDFWKVLTEYLPQLKDIIMARDGKVVIRPDSGDPVEIICGLPMFECNNKRQYGGSEFLHQMDDIKFQLHNTSYECIKFKDDYICKIKYPYEKITKPQQKGAVEVLWDLFGGTINEKGYKVLDSHIGLIYGDSITIERANEILKRLETKGFASSNIVFGIGSYTYNYNTRDSFGMAVKSTYVEVGFEPREIEKDPKTGDGVKKSAKGLLCVQLNEKGEFVLKDQCTKEMEEIGELKTVFFNGRLTNADNLINIRKRLEIK